MSASEPARSNRGLFIALEGPDGCGKSSRIPGLIAWLNDQGRDAIACRDPGGSPLGERVRSILLERSNFDISPAAELLLFMAARAQLVAEVIKPALAAGKIVVSDRYLISNIVYQAYAYDVDASAAWTVGAVATGGLAPDLVLLLDVPAGVAIERIGAARDRLEDRPLEYREKVRRGFLEIAAGGVGVPPQYRSAIRVIDGRESPEAVELKLREEVSRALAQHQRT